MVSEKLRNSTTLEFYAMDRITVDQALTAQLEATVVPVELVDKAGRPLGHFVPRLATGSHDDCPYSLDQLEAMRHEKGGRPLFEILRSLGAR